VCRLTTEDFDESLTAKKKQLAPERKKEGTRGVYFHAGKNRWYARIQRNHVTYQSGYFHKQDDAILARQGIENELNKDTR